MRKRRHNSGLLFHSGSRHSASGKSADNAFSVYVISCNFTFAYCLLPLAYCILLIAYCLLLIARIDCCLYLTTTHLLEAY